MFDMFCTHSIERARERETLFKIKQVKLVQRFNERSKAKTLFFSNFCCCCYCCSYLVLTSENKAFFFSLSYLKKKKKWYELNWTVVCNRRMNSKMCVSKCTFVNAVVFHLRQQFPNDFLKMSTWIPSRSKRSLSSQLLLHWQSVINSFGVNIFEPSVCRAECHQL